MKTFIFILTFFTTIQVCYSQEFHINYLELEKDSSLWMYLDVKKEHTIFAYSEPDTNSTKLLLISIYTYNVEGNPHNCKYGAYYSTASFNNYTLKMINIGKDFVKANLIKDETIKDKLYFQRKWIRIN